jgi:hypothetical protein
MLNHQLVILLANPLFEEEASTFFNGCEHENGNSPTLSSCGSTHYFLYVQNRVPQSTYQSSCHD